MATFVFTDARVEINGVDLSDHVRQVTLDTGNELQDDTAMGMDTRSSAPGLGTWGVTVEFLQDFAASEVDATIWALKGTTFTVKVRPTTGSISATNPEYSGTATLAQYAPMGGAVGDQAGATASFVPAGGSAATLARATS